MPFTVITLKKVPDSLRGDLTRWMQEIATGVYVGNYNSRVREYLWKRVTDTIGNGEAIMCYSCRNEIGYSFSTLIPKKSSHEADTEMIKQGFSNASKYHKAKRRVIGNVSSQIISDTNEKSFTAYVSAEKQGASDLVFLDIETTGLDVDNDQIIEIGAIKVSGSEKKEFHRLIRADIHVPDVVRTLTGISDDMLKNGTELESSIRDLHVFIQDSVLVGYNIAFDIRFINKSLEKYSLELIHNKTLELMHEAKKRNSFQTNYKFETTLKEYGIRQKVLHRALEDAKLMLQLYNNTGLE